MCPLLGSFPEGNPYPSWTLERVADGLSSPDCQNGVPAHALFTYKDLECRGAGLFRHTAQPRTSTAPFSLQMKAMSTPKCQDRPPAYPTGSPTLGCIPDRLSWGNRVSHCLISQTRPRL